MPRNRPWYKREPAAWLHGTRHLTLEERGAYGDIIEYLNDRDAPLPDEDRFIAGLLNCPPQRWRKIRARLLALGKIMLDEQGRITNERFEREHAGRELYRLEQANHAREAHEHREPGFDFAPHARAHGDSEKSQQSSKNVGKKVQTKLREISDTMPSRGRETPKNDEGTHAPRARALRVSELREGDSSLPSPPCNPPEEGRLFDNDLMGLFDAVCEAAGYRPTQPSAIDRALRQVETWRDEGMDFGKVVIPTIERFLLDHAKDGPTRTLGRFRAHIAHEHARQKASQSNGKAYRPPKVPVLVRDDEHEDMAKVRALLAQALGPNTYAIWFNELKLEQGDDRPDWLTIRGHMSTPLAQSSTMMTVRMVARKLGYSEVFAR